MYVPPKYRPPHPDDAWQLVHQHPFAVFITTGTDGLPLATQIPLHLTGEGSTLRLQGHLARANPQARQLSQGQPALALFTGPHAYVSPSWYAQPNVPTWNYLSAQVRGTVRLLSAQETEAALQALMAGFESPMPNPRAYHEVSEEDLAADLRALTAFELTGLSITAAYKLSQNRTPKDYENIIHELEQLDPQSREVAAAMRRYQKSSMSIPKSSSSSS